MNTGQYISGIGHMALILWVLFGGFFASSRLPEMPQAADVSLISAEEFAALSAPQSVPQPVTDVATPVMPEAEAPPEPPVQAEAPPQVEQPEAEAPDEPDPTPAVPDAPAPEPSEVNDEVAVLVPPPQTEVPEVTTPSDTPTPRPAPRVAPLPVPEAPETPEIADTPVPRISPDAETDVRAEEEPPAAPEEATTEIVTEAEEPSSAAPTASPRPAARPPRPVRRAETPAPAPAPQPDPLADAVAGAVADALETPAPAPAPSVPTGPPLTSGEKDALRIAVQRCWNVGSLSTDALATTVVVAVTMAQDGRPETGSIRMLDHSGGSTEAARQAFEAARRAIIRCGANGFDLPAEKYGQWQNIEITFNPENMRIK